MLNFRFTAVAVLAVAAALVGLTACGGSTSAATNGQKSTRAQAQDVTIHYKLVASDDDVAKADSDGQKHDTFWALDSTTVHVGDKVTIIVDNFDDMPHSMVFPELGIDQDVAGGKEGQPGETTFTLTATKTGTFRWYCDIPCDTDQDQWAMKDSSSGPSVDDFMAGYITVTA